MLAFAVKRLLASIPLLLGVLTLVFFLLEAAPGEPFQTLSEPGTDPHAAERLRRAFGADRPVGERYVEWLGRFLTGDLGVSPSHRRPVADLVQEAAGNTVALAGSALVLQFLAGIAAGTASAWTRGRLLDRAITVAASVLYSVPSYWLGLVLAWVLSVRLGLLPASQMHSLDAPSLGALARLADAARHMVLPGLSLVLPTAAGIALTLRDRMASALATGYAQSARARGRSRGGVVVRHALRSSLLPAVNLLGLAVPALLGGSVVIEVHFAWPGMGRLAYQAVLARDTPLVLGCTCASAVLVLLGSLAADLLGAILDPRVREATA